MVYFQLPLVTTILFSLCSQIFAFSPGFPYGSQKVRGVNLGGWLVLEPFITPSLFDNTGDSRIIDEWTFCQYQSVTTATNALKHHWDTWITEADFDAIAAAGLNHVRIPIGYWAFDIRSGEPFITGQLPYLLKAVDWAAVRGIKVVVDLHGAPGSQNGFNHSGRQLSFPLWHTDYNNVARTNAIIRTLASLFRDKPSVVSAINPLNEPAGFFGNDLLSVLKQFWYDSYGNIRYPYGTSRQSETVLMIHDAFMPLSYWNGFMSWPGWEGVILDTHLYYIFSVGEIQMSNEKRISVACEKGPGLASFHLWTVVGEWSPSPTDCAKYLNGRGAGSRYDGTFPGSTRVGSCSGLTGKASTFSASYKTFLRQLWEAQTISYEKGQGWIQWTWKAEEADEWSYQAGLAHGWIPSNPTDRQYPNICG